MSIICAMSIEGETAIASNSGYILAQDSKIADGADKWIFFQGWALGVTGTMLGLNVLRSDLLKADSTFDTEKDVVIEIGKILTEYDIGYKPNEDATWDFGVNCILVSADGRIWDIDCSLCLGPIPAGTLWARGSGEKYALGAASALTQNDPNAEALKIVAASAQAAIDCDLYCPGILYSKRLESNE